MNKKIMRYGKRKIIYVDVDGTLLIGQSLNLAVVDWLRKKKEDGFRLFLWSSRGGRYARGFAEAMMITDLFEQILPKPSFLVDDMGKKMFSFCSFISKESELF